MAPTPDDLFPPDSGDAPDFETQPAETPPADDLPADPVDLLKLVAAQYGIPGEAIDAVADIASDLLDMRAERAEAADAARLLSAARDAAHVGADDLVPILVDRARKILIGPGYPETAGG